MPFTPRSRHDWHLRTRTLPLGQRTIVMGIPQRHNPTPSPTAASSTPPRHAPERALEQALKMLDEGATISTSAANPPRPNAAPLTADEEQSRILPAIEAILKEKPTTILSVDTFHAATARRAIEAGAEIINDVSRPPLGTRICPPPAPN